MDTQSSQAQATLSIEAILGGSSICPESLQCDTLLSSGLSAQSSVPHESIASFARPLPGSADNSLDTLGTLLDTSVTIDDLLGTHIIGEGLDVNKLLSEHSALTAEEILLKGTNQEASTWQLTYNSAVSSVVPSNELNQFNMPEKKADALVELLRITREKEIKETVRLDETAPSKKNSAILCVLGSLQRCNDGVLYTVLRWYRECYLKKTKPFNFEEPSPDDLIRHARSKDILGGAFP